MYGSQQPRSNEQPPASQEQPTASQDQVPTQVTQVAVASMNNSADIFTVPLSSLGDLGSVHAIPGFHAFGSSMQVVLRGNQACVSGFGDDGKSAWTKGDVCLSLAQQYCFVEQSASLGSWWTGVLGTTNTVLSGVLRSIGDYARVEAFVVGGESRCFILSSLALSYKAFLFAPQVLSYFSMARNIGCALGADEHSLSTVGTTFIWAAAWWSLLPTFICRS